MTNTIRVSVALAVCLAGPKAVWAATLQGVHGEVLVNRGDGYFPVGSDVNVPAGCSVQAKPGSGVDILYDDGCVVPVEPGTVMVVQTAGQCAPGTAGAQRGGIRIPMGSSPKASSKSPGPSNNFYVVDGVVFAKRSGAKCNAAGECEDVDWDASDKEGGCHGCHMVGVGPWAAAVGLALLRCRRLSRGRAVRERPPTRRADRG